MPALQLDQMGITHFAFTVPDTEAFLDELLAKGVQSYLTMRQNSHALYQHRSVAYALSEPALSGDRRGHSTTNSGESDGLA